MSKIKPLGPVEKSARGFEFIHFKEHNDHECSLQVSSLALYQKPGTSAVWLGVEDIKPMVMWKDDATCGWVPYPMPPVPPEVSLHTRMHLTRSQVESLVAHLQQWLKNDTLKFP